MEAVFLFFAKWKAHLVTLTKSIQIFSFLIRKNFQFFFSKVKVSKEMEATEVSIQNTLSCREFLVFVVKSYKLDIFIMGYHVYKTAWTHWIKVELCGATELTYLMDNDTDAV